jgi:G3E family GTPase
VPGAVAAGVVAAVDPATLIADLFGDDLLAERGAALSADDRRAVGEALVEQVEFADAVAVPTAPGARPGRVLAHLVAAPAAVQPIDALDVHALLHARRPDGDPRGDVLQVGPTGVPDGDGVWTLDLRSPRALHPERLLAALEVLALGPLRGRGVFWLPTRPGTVCAWNGAGGQLSIGSVGRWGNGRRSHLVVTGVDHDPEPLRRAFHDALLTDPETSAGPSRWTARPDSLDAWLGESRMSA